MSSVLKEMFSDGDSVSCMRVMAFVSLAIGGFLAVAGLYNGKDLTSLSYLCGVFVGSAFGGKALQTKFENNKES